MSPNSASLFPEPPLDPAVASLFKSFCDVVPQSEAASLRQDISEYLPRLQTAMVQNEFLDIDTATRIADVLVSLLDQYQSFSPTHQSLVVGAARYFLKDGDAEPDTASPLGFDDDAAVLNHVLSAIGQHHRRITL